MDPDAARSVFCPFIDAVHGIDDRLDPISAKFIAENIQAYFLIRCIKCSDGSCDALNRAAVTEGLPGAEPGNNGPAAGRCVGNPSAPVL